MKAIAGALLSAAMLAGCASMGAPMTPVAPLTGPRPEAVSTLYTDALRCLAGHVRAQSYAPPRVAVGLITDMTGANDRETGRRLTQGATLMAITALSETGVRLVERYDMGVLQVEMDYARNGLLRDSEQVIREVRSGEIQGADLYLIGGISEYNPNIRSRGIDGFSGGTSGDSGSVSIGAGDYVIDVAIDLRLVDARSSEILGVRSLRKQIVGREVRAGVFAFLDGTVVDIGGGQRAMEPVQTAVRTMVDQIVFEFIAALYSFSSDSCLSQGSIAGADPGVDSRGRFSQALEAQPLPAVALQSTKKPPAPLLIAEASGAQTPIVQPVAAQTSAGAQRNAAPAPAILALSPAGSAAMAARGEPEAVTAPSSQSGAQPRAVSGVASAGVGGGGASPLTGSMGGLEPAVARPAPAMRALAIPTSASSGPGAPLFQDQAPAGAPTSQARAFQATPARAAGDAAPRQPAGEARARPAAASQGPAAHPPSQGLPAAQPTALAPAGPAEGEQGQARAQPQPRPLVNRTWPFTPGVS